MLICSEPFLTSASPSFYGDDNQNKVGISDSAGSAPLSNHSKKLKDKLTSILFMDDEKALRLVVRLMLERLGYAVTTAEHGRQALALYEASTLDGQPFDVVILDINIENGMGGIETFENLLKINPHVKVIGASGSVTQEFLNDLHKVGFFGVLAKPFQLEQLRKTLEEVLRIEVV